MPLLQAIGKKLTHFLAKQRDHKKQIAPTHPEKLAKTLQSGDVLLVEGSSRFSSAIKYLSQSNWSHSALYVGDIFGPTPAGEEPRLFIEADIVAGVRAVPLSQYTSFGTRICRPVGLSPEDLDKVIAKALSRMHHKYDLKNIFDLARYLIQMPPVPVQWRRRMIALGSGDPTRAICSSLIAEAFQSVHYPILPLVEISDSSPSIPDDVRDQILHIRHHSLYTPRDFDVSPYFSIIKPTIACGFDHRKLTWADTIKWPE